MSGWWAFDFSVGGRIPGLKALWVCFSKGGWVAALILQALAGVRRFLCVLARVARGVVFEQLSEATKPFARALREIDRSVRAR